MMASTPEEDDSSIQAINEENENTKKGGGLSEYLTKNLLRDFEGSGETRESFDLLGFCDCNAEVYGVKGSLLRYQVQQRWNKVKRRELRSYLGYLKRLKIPPGTTATSRLDHQSKKEKRRKTMSSSNPNTSDDERSCSSTTSSTASISSNDTSTLDSFHTSQGDERKTPAKTSKTNKKEIPVTELFASPKRKSSRKKKAVAPSAVVLTLPPTHPRQHTSHHLFGETSPLIGQFEATSTPQAFMPVSWLVDQNGSWENPWIVKVDVERAESNRDFNVEHVVGIDQDDMYTRNGFHISRTVAAPDHEEWTATIPTHIERQYAKRVIMIKGPSQDFWQRLTEKYHEDGHVACAATKRAHSATEIAIEDAPGRQWSYFLLVFPPSIILTNLIFSRDEEVVPVGKIPMKSKSAENHFKKDLRAMVLFWKIAIKGGKKVGKGSKHIKKKKTESMFT
jgi:hypothetical protein